LPFENGDQFLIAELRLFLLLLLVGLFKKEKAEQGSGQGQSGGKEKGIFMPKVLSRPPMGVPIT